MPLDLNLDESMSEGGKPPSLGSADELPSEGNALNEPQAKPVSLSPAVGRSGALTEAQQSLREQILAPEGQLQSVMEVQIAQLNNLLIAIRRFQELAEQVEAEKQKQSAMWGKRSEAYRQSLDELSKAKREQEELLQKLSAGLIAAKDEDTKRVENAVRILAQAQAGLTAATEAVTGTGNKFETQIVASLGAVEQGLTKIVGDQTVALAESADRLQGKMKPLRVALYVAWVILIGDMVVRILLMK